MPKDTTARKRRYLPGCVRDARQLETLLADPDTGQDVRAALWRGLTEAMQARGVSILTPEVAKAIFLAIYDRYTDLEDLDRRQDEENRARGCVSCHYRSAPLRLIHLISYAAADDLDGFKHAENLGCARCREALRRTADGDDAPAHVRQAGGAQFARIPDNPWRELSDGWHLFVKDGLDGEGGAR